MNTNNQRQTYWQQLTQGGINAVLFWALNIVIVGAYFWNRTGDENAPYVLYGALIMQLVNVLVTYFQKENQRLRNLPIWLGLLVLPLLSCQRNPVATAEANTERPTPDAWAEQHPSDTMSTYTDARQFEVPLASR